MKKNSQEKILQIETELISIGNNPEQQFGFVSPPIYRGSTAIYPDVPTMKTIINSPLKLEYPNYGRFGTPSSHNYENSLAKLEGGFNTVLTGSGLSAITTAILTFLKTGDHILVSDSVYLPTRNFTHTLARFGIQVDYFNPRWGKEIKNLIKPNTRVCFLESPGSLTFEIQDIAKIAEISQKNNIITMIDNTWSTPMFFKPLELGIDISIHSGTKYLTGHADSFLGAIICNSKTYPEIRTQALQMGQFAAPEDVQLGLRGLRTLDVRLQRHQKSALTLAHWLESQPEIQEVLHPALPTSKDHHLWKKYFSGSSGLFGFHLKNQWSSDQINQMIHKLELFKLGHSWGGFESLVMISDPANFRTTSSFKEKGALLRLHIGLENVEDLKNDLRNALNSL